MMRYDVFLKKVEDICVSKTSGKFLFRISDSCVRAMKRIEKKNGEVLAGPCFSLEMLFEQCVSSCKGFEKEITKVLNQLRYEVNCSKVEDLERIKLPFLDFAEFVNTVKQACADAESSLTYEVLEDIPYGPILLTRQSAFDEEGFMLIFKLKGMYKDYKKYLSAEHVISKAFSELKRSYCKFHEEDCPKKVFVFGVDEVTDTCVETCEDFELFASTLHVVKDEAQLQIEEKPSTFDELFAMDVAKKAAIEFARKNSVSILGLRCGRADEELADLSDELMHLCEKVEPYVVTSKRISGFGAAALMVPDVFKEVADTFGNDLYVCCLSKELLLVIREDKANDFPNVSKLISLMAQRYATFGLNAFIYDCSENVIRRCE